MENKDEDDDDDDDKFLGSIFLRNSALKLVM
jgi:hypothetical protein